MITGRYSLKQLLTHNEIEQIIIPEIQRDYVWDISNVNKLLEDILSGFGKKQSLQLEIKANGTLEQRESVMQFLTQEYERLIFQQKLGFIYAYHDRDYAGKFFLIDGQQRITTLFLMLLSLYKLINKEIEFKELYFKNGLPKVDYKVREQSHDFLFLLISSVLEGKSYKDAEHFYSKEYLKDISIIHLIENFEFIEKQVASITDKKGFLDYLENFVEVNYFDTHLSEQGEQLYIYMNSRGEQLSHQEIVRAELMQKIKEPKDKIHLGNEWEKWQNYFWKHRWKNENADKGFEEFLKWATIIHLAVNENDDVINFLDPTKSFTKKQLKENYIKDSFKGESERKQKEAIFNYQIKHLHFDFLKKLFDAIEWLYRNKTKYIPINENWLASGISVSDYVLLLPVLHFLSINKWENSDDKIVAVERFAMFLKNINYFEAVSKNPDTATIDTLEIAKDLKEDKKDVTHILQHSSVTKTIITDAEKYKLELFKNNSHNRSEWEKVIWDITLDDEFNKFLMGDISVVWKCLEKENSNDDFVLRTPFSEYVVLIKEIIYKNRNSDKLRRLILSKFDYLIESGTGGGGLEKYSFVGNGNNWEVLREWKETLVKNDFIELLVWVKNEKTAQLDTLISNAKKQHSIIGWREAFADIPSLLKYCTNKKILWQDEQRILLLEKTNYSSTLSREIQCALLQNSFSNEGMWIYENNVCVLEFDWNDSNDKVEFKPKGNQGYAVDFKYSFTNKKWTFSLLHRENSIIEFIKIPESQEWKAIEDRLTIKDGELYCYDTQKSLLQNNQEMVQIVNRLIVKIENLIAANKE